MSRESSAVSPARAEASRGLVLMERDRARAGPLLSGLRPGHLTPEDMVV